MSPVTPELLSWADFLAKCGQFLFGLCSLVLAIWAAIFKRKDLFRTELAKKQLDELGKVRNSLQSIFFDLHYIPGIHDMARSNEWNLDGLKEKAPESWEQYTRYKNTSLDLFYKFSDSNYYLFPKWIDIEKRRRFADAMEAFAPFTLVATAAKCESDMKTYADEIVIMKEYFDDALQTHI